MDSRFLPSSFSRVRRRSQPSPPRLRPCLARDGEERLAKNEMSPRVLTVAGGRYDSWARVQLLGANCVRGRALQCSISLLVVRAGWSLSARSCACVRQANIRQLHFLSERPCACVPVPRFEKQRRGRGPPLAADLLRFCASRERIAISRAKTGSSSSSFSLPLFEFRVVRAGLKTPAGCPTAGRHAFSHGDVFRDA